MTKIVTSLKDAEKADPRAVLLHSRAQRFPFGIQTYTLRLDNVSLKDGFNKKSEKFREKALRKRLVTDLSKRFERDCETPEQAKALIKRVSNHSRIPARLREALEKPNLCNAVAFPFCSVSKGGKHHAHQIGADEFIDPVLNVVIAPPSTFSSAGFFKVALGASNYTLETLPGTDAHWQTFALWHEYSHGAGAGEAQADKMAGIVYRQLFDDPRVLAAFADMRAVAAVLRGNDEKYFQKYGWGPVAALDTVVKMPQEKINEMSAEDVKAIRFENIDHQWPAVKNIRRILGFACKSILPEGKSKTVASPEELRTLGSKTLDFVNAGLFDENPKEKRIAMRFAMAALRLTKGEKHYRPLIRAAATETAPMSQPNPS